MFANVNGSGTFPDAGGALEVTGKTRVSGGNELTDSFGERRASLKVALKIGHGQQIRLLGGDAESHGDEIGALGRRRRSAHGIDGVVDREHDSARMMVTAFGCESAARAGEARTSTRSPAPANRRSP